MSVLTALRNYNKRRGLLSELLQQVRERWLVSSFWNLRARQMQMLMLVSGSLIEDGTTGDQAVSTLLSFAR
tara:strand:- start:204 stop:416 length:213 start_codon:yes stop_codon:yes gene_type:complete